MLNMIYRWNNDKYTKKKKLVKLWRNISNVFRTYRLSLSIWKQNKQHDVYKYYWIYHNIV